jgi:hypothetical protein
MTEQAEYQGMSAAVMAELLAFVQAFDKNFVPDELDVQAYLVVARDYRWTFHEAEAAIRKWGGDHPEGQRMDPSVLNRLVRTARQDRLSREAAPARPQGQPYDGDLTPVGDDPYWGKNNSPELEKIHEVCLPFTCEHCGQKPGERCMNKITKNGTKIPHLSRLKQAGVSRSYP